MGATVAAQTKQLADHYVWLREQHGRLARTNMRAFFSYVMRDEATGGAVDMTPMHEAWHDLAEKYDRLIIWSFMECGKTFELSIARVLWILGRYPSLRGAIVSNTTGQAAKIARTIAQYIERSTELHEVFPDLRPDQSMPWNTEQLTVRRPYISKDPTVQVLGIGSNIQGARLDFVILDDVLNHENTRTQGMRDGVWDWYHHTIPGRVTERGRILCVGNVWNKDDLLHRLCRNPLWHGFKFPLVLPDGSSAWPKRWPPARIEKRRIELGPIEWQIQMLCTAIDDSASRFRRAWIEKCLARGEGKDVAYAIREIPPGCKVYIGNDLGVGRKITNDQTVFFALMIHPNGDREVLCIEAGRWLADKIMGKVVELHARFHGILIIENVAAQDYLVQLLQGAVAVPIKPFTTGKNKVDPTFGLEAMGAELAAGKWIIPNRNGVCDPEVQEWINEMLSYSPAAHTGDRLMASWFAKEGERLGALDKPIETGIVTLKLSKW